MGFSVQWSWLAALLCLLCMGVEVGTDCIENSSLQMEGGNYTLTKKLKNGSQLIYHCPEGYYPYPALYRVCQSNNLWKAGPGRISSRKLLLQHCRLVECPDPTVMEFGNVSPPQDKYFVGNVTRYDCYTGYTLRGSSPRICQPNGKWNGSTPICSRNSDNVCPDPAIPPGTTRTGNVFDIDDKVTYSCNDNKMFLVGSKERMCQENGQWSGIEPACYYKHTYDTPMEVSQEFGLAIKDSLTTLESTNDTQGLRNIRIRKNGTMNIYIAVDMSESIDEIAFNNSKDAVLKLIEKISFFEVSPNYEVVFFSSIIFEAVDILDYFGGNIEETDPTDKIKQFTIIEKDTAGTNLNLVFLTFYERMAIIKERVGDETFQSHHHILVLFTDGAFNMGGQPSYTVERIKKLVPSEEFLDIYIFGIGAKIFDEDLQDLTTGTGGRHFFRMKDIKNLQDTFDEIIDESEVEHLCGLHKAFDPDKVDDKSIKRKMYPWMAFITIKNGLDAPMSCIGSLVTPQFVLTAAHCLPDNTENHHITVEIDDENNRGTKEKTVKYFKKHELYNVRAKVNQGVKEFYDYDVALIQLTNPVKISKDVRTICLPCTQATNDALKLVDSNTCKAQEQRLLSNPRERLAFLTKTNNLVDEKDVFAKLDDYRDACIKKALVAKDIITTTNEKEAVTDNFLCTGGLDYRTEHIACKGDSGGAVFKHYHHRTVQIGVVSWGTKNLCGGDGGGLVRSDDDSRDFHINLFRVVPFLKEVLDKEDADYEPLRFLEN